MSHAADHYRMMVISSINFVDAAIMGNTKEMRTDTDFAGFGKFLRVGLVSGLGLIASCGISDAVSNTAFTVQSTAGEEINVIPLAEFNQPWAMTFLPDGQLLVTEKVGKLFLVSLPEIGNPAEEADNELETIIVPVNGLPEITANGQGGLGDVILHPEFAENQFIYLSYVEREGDLSGAAVARASLDYSNPAGAQLKDLDVIWRQVPKVTGSGHYGHRMAFSPDGYLYITSGERQKFDPAQDMTMNLGKVLRLNDDGSVPSDNPFASQGGLQAQFWSLGHRNPLGIAFDSRAQLWVHEMGPRGGDELNRVTPGGNYGYPLVSEGRHYSGVPIPDHHTRPDLLAPAISWTPVISPSGFVVYDGEQFPDWQNTGLIGGLSSRSLIRVELDVPATEIERYDMGKRIREVEQGPDGFIYLLEDKSGGRLLRLNNP